ncbi:LysM peptidoglycan-binding domain-containing protein [Eionea flava]
MNKRFLYPLLLCLCIVLSSNNYAQEQPVIKANSPSSHTVVQGDTLWHISGKFLEDPWRWREIWQGNQQISNPNLIYPGDIVKLTIVDGKPVLTVDSSTPVADNNASTPNKQVYHSSAKLPTVKLSPQIYSTPINTTAIPEIPLERINSFLMHNRIVEPQVLEQAPHIVSGQSQRVILGAGDSMYARGTFTDTRQTYGIYSKGKEFIDPDTKTVTAVQAIALGSAEITAQEGDLTTFLITRSLMEIRVGTGNRLLPNKEREIRATFLPTPPNSEVSGKIINTESGLSQVGRLDVVTINLGRDNDLAQGTILGIYKAGGTITDRSAQQNTEKNVDLPNERAGLLMVFETFKKMSFAIVLEAEIGVTVSDIVGNP